MFGADSRCCVLAAVVLGTESGAKFGNGGTDRGAVAALRIKNKEAMANDKGAKAENSGAYEAGGSL